jgi:hypothetical protein
MESMIAGEFTQSTETGFCFVGKGQVALREEEGRRKRGRRVRFGGVASSKRMGNG